MRPDMTDQLAGIRRILTDIIAPELREGYPSQLLRGVAKNLAMLEGAWPHILPFLRWDNDQTAKLLRQVQPSVDDDLQRRITTALEFDDGADTPQALEQRNDELRELLSLAIRQLPDLNALRDGITAHFVERTDRYPLSMAIAAPTSAKS